MASRLYHNDKLFIKRLIYLSAKSADTAYMTVEKTRLTNVRALIKEAGGPAAAAERLNMDRSQLSQIAGRNPTRNIGATIARRIEAAWGKPTGWLDGTHEVQQLIGTYNVSEGPDLNRQVPLISWVQAGQWQDVVDNLAPGDSYKRMHTTARVSGAAYALRVVGDSMTNPGGSPSFPEGTILILDPRRDAEPGNFVVVRQNGDTECTFKQLIRDTGQYLLKPLNPRYPILQMREDAIICGVLVQAVMDF